VIDALGAPQSVLVLGATSDIATATLERFVAAGRLERAVLVARAPQPLHEQADHLRRLGVAEVHTEVVDALDAARVAQLTTVAFGSGDVDVVLVAFGVLPDQAAALTDPDVVVHTAMVNYVGAAAGCVAAATALRDQGHGVLVVLSSVAGERPRVANFVYGSTKAGLDALATGLGDHLHGSGARVLVVRPGFVRTKMTGGMRDAPLSVGPDDVAAAIAANLRGPSRTVWVPRTLRPVMSVLRHLPRPVFRRLPM
jgi:decaprenylphospho-beta-D-erythro-pentofuranosid-2-ulose 2-reductase